MLIISKIVDNGNEQFAFPDHLTVDDTLIDTVSSEGLSLSLSLSLFNEFQLGRQDEGRQKMVWNELAVKMKN